MQFSPVCFRGMKLTVVCTWLLVWSSSSLGLGDRLFAQDAAKGASSPRDVVEVYCKALTTKYVGELLDVFEEATAQKFGELILSSLKELHAKGDITLAHDLFGRELSDSEIGELTWKDVFIRHLCGPLSSDAKRYLARGTWSMNPNWLGGGPGSRKVIGVVQEVVEDEQELAHVVYRYEGMSPRPHEDFINLVTCWKVDEEWKILPSQRMSVGFLTRVAFLQQEANKRNENREPK